MVTESIKPAYRKAEIGVIPDDWDLISFDDAFDFLSTASYSRGQLCEDQDILYVHYGDIHTRWKHFLDFSKESLPSIDNAKLKTYSLIKEGDLIMADASEDYEGICKSVEVRNVGSKKAISGLHTFLLRSKKDVYVNGFKGYISSNKLVKTQFDRLATGLKVYGLSKTNLKVVLIPYPREKEQKAIFQVLSDTDNLIDFLNKLIRKKKHIKKGVMQELLTREKRLYGFKGEWEECKFTEIFAKNTTKNFQIKTNEYHDFGLYPIVDQGKQKIVGYSDKVNKVFKCPKIGVVIFGDHTREIKFVDFDFVVGADGTQILSTSNNNSTKFFYYLLKTKVIPNTGYNRHYKFLKEMVLLKPNAKEQSAIAHVLSDIDSEIKEWELRRDKYKMLKEGMIQQLLTGKIRLT